MTIQILYPGLAEPKQFNDLLAALTNVKANGKLNCFLIKISPNEDWDDGARMFGSFQEMFAPVEGDIPQFSYRMQGEG